jgi:ribosomal-protein-alanine N-acetyltransferase
MRLSDVEAVVELDTLSFPTPWPARTYRYEIANNDRSTMIVLEVGNAARSPNGSGISNWLKRISGEEPIHPSLIGFSGMWHIADEAHVSTIAVHPAWRGYRLGELLLWNMVYRAIQNDAKLVTLEVRVGNQIAQSLYRKYDFEIMGRRKGYYRDNGEDAYMMGVTPLDDEYRRKLIRYGRELAQRLKIANQL